MILLNFSHPLPSEAASRLELLAGQSIEETRSIPVQFENGEPFAGQAVALADACNLNPEEWQTYPILIIPPALNFIAVTLLAELHGRMGYFPPVVRIRPVQGSTPPRYTVAEIINLQEIRDKARRQRF